MAKSRIGVIGGTGLYSLEGLEVLETLEVDTPYGKPSAPLTVGKMGKNEIVFLPRHGLHHELLPSEINFRANIYALKKAGVREIISVSATGSLKKEIHPGELASVTQYIDFTKGKRSASFFGEGLVAHISSAHPTCERLAEHLLGSAQKVAVKMHAKKAYACVEGPRLGTRAESFFLISSGCDLVGMTNVPEAFLAREAQLCYTAIAVATDYDCWLDDPNEHVTLTAVLTRYKATLGEIKKILRDLFTRDFTDGGCGCRKALAEAVVTSPEHLGPEKKKLLDFLTQ